MTGKIVRLNKDKKFGFITGGDKKDYFFHRSALKNVDFDDLDVGREVTFEPKEGQKGPRAEVVYA